MLEVLWPSVCAGCETRGEGILCPRCTPGGAFRPGIALPGVSGVFTAAPYDGNVGRALKVAKYVPRRPVAVALASGFARALGPVLKGDRIDVVVPAPAAARRLIQRGFHPTALLARSVAEAVDRPVVHALALRPGGKQAALGARGRRVNTGGRVRSTRVFGGERVLLVDDVVTTGATAEACARELLGAGAGEVWLATLCASRTGVKKL
jgi:predicted amidophosphoribosyltransferase